MKVKNRVSIPLPSQNRSSSHSLVEWPLRPTSRLHRRKGEGFEAYIVKNNENIYLGELDTPQICTPAPKVPRRTSLVRNLKKAGRREAPKSTKKLGSPMKPPPEPRRRRPPPPACRWPRRAAQRGCARPCRGRTSRRDGRGDGFPQGSEFVSSGFTGA